MGAMLPHSAAAIVAMLFLLAPTDTPAGPPSDFPARLSAAGDAAARSARAGAVLDVKGCGLAFSGAFGVANRKAKIPMLVDDRLRLGSIGKLYAAAAIHRLAARQVLDLDAPASRYLRADDAVGVEGRDATLRQLLNHTAGVPDYYALPNIRRWDWTQPLTPSRILTAVKGAPATHAPGAAYAYSNTGYHLSALAAERAAGKPFAQIIVGEAIAPTGLTATRYHETAPGGRVHGYAGRADMWSSAENTGPDSGVTATAADVAAMLRALFSAGGTLQGAGDAMRANPVETGKPRQSAGPGVEIRTSRGGLTLVGHTGDVEGYLSFAYIAPDNGVTLVGHLTASDPERFGALLRETVAVVEEACAVSR